MNFQLGRQGQVHVVRITLVGQDKVLQLLFYLDPWLVRQRCPDVVSLGDDRLVWLEHDFGQTGPFVGRK